MYIYEFYIKFSYLLEVQTKLRRSFESHQYFIKEVTNKLSNISPSPQRRSLMMPNPCLHSLKKSILRKVTCVKYKLLKLKFSAIFLLI